MSDRTDNQPSAIDDLVLHAEAYAQTFTSGDLPRIPTKGLAVVTCMDGRINLAALLGLGEGDAHMIRNAGGVIGEGELRSLAVSQRLLGTTEIVVILHTDCGMRTFKDEEFRDQLEAETGVRPDWTPVAFGDVADDVRANVQRVLDDPFLPHKKSVRGFIYDVKTGQLSEVV
jgi:carbonic anhydrase